MRLLAVCRRGGAGLKVSRDRIRSVEADIRRGPNSGTKPFPDLSPSRATQNLNNFKRLPPRFSLS